MSKDDHEMNKEYITKKLIEGKNSGLIQMKAKKEREKKHIRTNRKQWKVGRYKPRHRSNELCRLNT